MTSIMGTEICGSSSRGVARIASSPTAREARVMSGVSFERRKRPAMRPATPMSAPSLVRLRDEDPVAGAKTGENLDGAVRGGAEPHPAELEPGHRADAHAGQEIGRASCRERVW